MGRIILILAVALIAYLLFRGVRAESFSGGRKAELLQLCHGDAVRMEGLIADEVRRTPDLSRDEAMDRAIESLRQMSG